MTNEEELTEHSIADLIVSEVGDPLSIGMPRVKARMILSLLSKEEEAIGKEALKLCVKTCPILNKLLLDYPEVKLDLYLESISLKESKGE